MSKKTLGLQLLRTSWLRYSHRQKHEALAARGQRQSCSYHRHSPGCIRQVGSAPAYCLLSRKIIFRRARRRNQQEEKFVQKERR